MSKKENSFSSSESVKMEGKEDRRRKVSQCHPLTPSPPIITRETRWMVTGWVSRISKGRRERRSPTAFLFLIYILPPPRKRAKNRSLISETWERSRGSSVDNHSIKYGRVREAGITCNRIVSHRQIEISFSRPNDTTFSHLPFKKKKKPFPPFAFDQRSHFELNE